MSDGMLEELVDAEGAARILGLKVSTVRRLTYTRELPVVRPTGRRAVRFRVRDLQDLLRMRSQPARASVT
jgi:excisionase family DNA binding protein